MKQTWVLLAACAAMASGVSAQEAGGKPDLAKAQQIVSTVCAACHGADGNSASAANPSLAGQLPEYITLQLTHFKSGVRNNPVMAAIVSNLTPEDMRALGLYFGAKTPKAAAAKDPMLAAAGQKLYRGGSAANATPACASCHAPNGGGIPVRYPRLSGQYADYTFAQLQAFKAGERGMDKDGKDTNGKIMNQIAARMSEHDMRAVAEYTSGLR
jgi:cytochrome c553